MRKPKAWTISFKKEMAVSGTIALEADDDELVARLLKRGETSGRPDDQDETKIRNRFDEYNQTAPLPSTIWRRKIS